MTVENYAQHHVPSLHERICRKLGFRYHLGDEPSDTDALEGWMRTNARFEFGFLDRLRLLLTGRLHVSLTVHHDTPSATICKSRLDWRIYAPGLENIVASGNSVFSPPVPEGCSHIFAPCLDPGCERPCGARRAIPEINLDIAEERRAIARRLGLLPLIAVLTLAALACVPQALGNIRNVQIANSEP